MTTLVALLQPSAQNVLTIFPPASFQPYFSTQQFSKLLPSYRQELYDQYWTIKEKTAILPKVYKIKLVHCSLLNLWEINV